MARYGSHVYDGSTKELVWTYSSLPTCVASQSMVTTDSLDATQGSEASTSLLGPLNVKFICKKNKDGTINKNVVICSFCKKEFAYHRSCSSLIYHSSGLRVCLHCFPHTLIIVTLRSGVRSVSAPPHEGGSQTYSSSHVNSDDSQQTIYNLQPARNVFYEMCFIKKEAQRPTRAGSFVYFFGPNLARTCGSGRVCRAGPTRWEL